MSTVMGDTKLKIILAIVVCAIILVGLAYFEGIILGDQ